MADDREKLLALACDIERERKWLEGAANLLVRLSGRKRDDLRAMIGDAARLREQQASEIRSLAASSRQDVAAILYDAATKLDTGSHDVPKLLAEAAAMLNNGPVECYVTLLQMGAIISRKKRTMRRLYDDGKLPPPAVEGTGGKPHEWKWSEVRPILEVECGRPLPAIFPADQFVRS